MKIFENIKRKNERGVALLFAIGFLSLLLVLGLAFVSNSLLARKNAKNNSCRSQAKILAQSATNRVAMAIKFYQAEYGNGLTASDLSSVVCSHAPNKDTDFVNHRADECLGFDAIRLAASAASYDSVLDVSTNSNKYLGKDSNADWLLIKEPTTNEIIGRMAYWILPSLSPSRLCLQHILDGYYNVKDGDYKYQPWYARRGTDTAELNIAQTTVFSGWPWISVSPDAETHNNISTDLSSFANSWSTYFNTDDKKKWLYRWFVGGNTKAEYEAYTYYTNQSGNPGEMVKQGQGTSFHRFNLARTDWDTALGLGAENVNTEAAVNRLLMCNADNTNLDNMAEILKFKTSGTTPDNLGIPFMKMIGNSAGTFEKLEDRRRQIAANLLDYCDADDVPTSNIPAANWDYKDSAKWPAYTGNEKTLYVNEIALGFKTKVSFKNGTDNFANFPVKVKVEVTPELIVELVDIYGLPASEEYTVEAQIEDISFDLAPDVKIPIKYKVGILPLSKDFSGSLDEATTVKFDSNQTVSVTFDGSVDVSGSGYRLSSGGMTSKSVEMDFSSKALAVWNSLGVSTTINSAEITEMSLKLSNVKVKLGSMVLKKKNAKLADGNTGEIAVDFVQTADKELSVESGIYLYRTNKGNEDHLTAAADSEGAKFSDFTDDSTIRNRFYICGFEAKDPRQNLFMDFDNDATSDWKIASSLKVYGYDGKPKDSDDVWPSFAITPSAGEVKERLTAGKVNSASDPSAAGTDKDVETVTDPAWVSASQHLSTAYIRNAPMKSYWELGAVHRGTAWETINLKNAQSRMNSKAVSPADYNPAFSITDTDGYSYGKGDGGILDQVKFTDGVLDYGKVDVNMLNSDYDNYMAWDADIVNMLLGSIRLGQWYSDLGTEAEKTAGSAISSGDISSVKNHFITPDANNRPFASRAAFLAWAPSGRYYNGFGALSSATTDGRQEELIGKTIGLMKTASLPSQVLQALIVVQTVKDVGNNVIVKRLDDNGTVQTSGACTIGKFDFWGDSANHNFAYFDEITGEVKLLVTYEWNPATGKIRIRQTEYID